MLKNDEAADDIGVSFSCDNAIAVHANGGSTYLVEQ